MDYIDTQTKFSELGKKFLLYFITYLLLEVLFSVGGIRALKIYNEIPVSIIGMIPSLVILVIILFRRNFIERKLLYFFIPVLLFTFGAFISNFSSLGMLFSLIPFFLGVPLFMLLLIRILTRKDITNIALLLLGIIFGFFGRLLLLDIF